ncbi:MAG: hypothetical protein V3R58_08855 [candidate division NC10 bacterium]
MSANQALRVHAGEAITMYAQFASSVFSGACRARAPYSFASALLVPVNPDAEHQKQVPALGEGALDGQVALVKLSRQTAVPTELSFRVEVWAQGSPLAGWPGRRGTSCSLRRTRHET